MSERLEDLNDDVRYPARRKMVIFLIVSFSLFALIFAAVEIENWRGRSAWNKYQREAEAKGETFDILKLAPPIVPNESNFASIPMFAQLFDYTRDSAGKPQLRETDELDENLLNINGATTNASPDPGNWIIGRRIILEEWQTYYQNVKLENNNPPSQSPFGNRYSLADGSRKSSSHVFPTPDVPGAPAIDVLLALGKFDAPLAELRTASARPFSRFPINYEDHSLAIFPHLSILRRASPFLKLRALANLEAGHRDEATDDVLLNLRVANALRGEPSLLSQNVRIALVTTALHPMWEGLGQHAWTEAQLLAFQKELGKFDFLDSYQLAIRGERAFNVLTMEQIRTNRSESVPQCLCSPEGQGHFHIRSLPFYMMPDGWFYQNQNTIARLYGIALKILEPASQRLNRNALLSLADAQAESQQGFIPCNMYVGFLFPGSFKPVIKFSFAHTSIDQAILACALERYRLAHGIYPATLAELAPRFIERIPHDIINGEPLKYRLTADGKFILHSVGWNETDDGGTVALSSSGRSHRMEEGDWVWSYSTNSSNEKPSEPDSDSP